MAKKRVKSEKQDAKDGGPIHQGGDVSQIKQPEKVHVGDTSALKRTLDDTVAETLRSAGFRINYVYTDLKIILGGTACLSAVVAQFWPGKYPSTQWVLLSCIVIYGLLSMALTAIVILFEKDTIVLTHPFLGQLSGLIVRSKLPRFQDKYMLAIRASGSARGSIEEAKIEESVGIYFDSNGVLAVNEFQGKVLQLLRQVPGFEAFESKKS